MRRFSHPLIGLLVILLLTSCTHQQVPLQDLKTGEQDKQILEQGLTYLQMHPEDVEARIFVGNAAWRMGLHDQALKIWLVDDERIVERDVYLGELLIQSMIEQGNLREAEHLLIVKPPDSIPQSLLLERQQRLAQIRSDRIQAADEVQRGDDALLAGEFDRALDFYKRAVDHNPAPGGQARLHAIRAWVMLQTDGAAKSDEIAQALSTALHLDSSPPVLYLDALVQHKLGDGGRVSADLKLLRESFPDSPFTLKAKELE